MDHFGLQKASPDESKFEDNSKNRQVLTSFGRNWISICLWHHFPNGSPLNHQYHMALKRYEHEIDENGVGNVNSACMTSVSTWGG
jgi:hypothetical protein